MQTEHKVTNKISLGMNKAAFAITRGGRDLEMWEDWKKSGSQKDLEKLFDRFGGLINTHVNQWSSQQIPRSSLLAEAEKQSLRAFETYDPGRGASLATHVQQRLRKLHSYAAKHGGIAVVPEDRFSGARRFKEAEEFLRRKFGREASVAEVSDEMNLPVAEIKRYRQENKQILTEGKGSADFSEIKVSDPKEAYALRMAYYELSSDEKVVYEYINGIAGKIKTSSNGEIARLSGLSPSKVSRLKSKIADKIEKFL